jgi:hypothetical protein
MRWYGPFIALTYDWLHDAPTVDEALREQTRTCLTGWVDYYTRRGYLAAVPGANYNAGFVAGKVLAAIAFAGENGSDGDRLWTEAIDVVLGQTLVARGLAGRRSPLGGPYGALVDGDWAEGWQYGPLSVLEYAAAARAAKENGASFPELDEWTNALIVRYVHATVPHLDGQYIGGDFERDGVYQAPTLNQLDAVLLGPSSDEAAGWAAKLKQLQGLGRGAYIWNALAELRPVTPADYRAQRPAPPRWFIARGTRTLYVRTSWDPTGLWAVFSSPPHIVPDHQHFAAGNFVLSRSADHLIVDPSTYGEPGTLATNAIGVDSPGVGGKYRPSQTPWSGAELVWARGTESSVYAARSDFGKAFTFASRPSDVSFALRDWVFLPEGEIVTIDRVRTADAAHAMHLNFHTNTGGTLALTGAMAAGIVGASKVVIHSVTRSGGTPSIVRPPVANRYEYPCGDCLNTRFPVDDYALDIPGPWAVAVHVIDALPAKESPALVGSVNDDAYDPAPKQNTDVLGAAVSRGSTLSFVIASNRPDGRAGATMKYQVPGASPTRHVVFDAPETADGLSAISTAARGRRCIVTITPGAGLAGRPLIFSLSGAQEGCTVTADAPAAPAAPPTSSSRGASAAPRRRAGSCRSAQRRPRGSPVAGPVAIPGGGRVKAARGPLSCHDSIRSGRLLRF